MWKADVDRLKHARKACRDVGTLQIGQARRVKEGFGVRAGGWVMPRALPSADAPFDKGVVLGPEQLGRVVCPILLLEPAARERGR